MRYRLQDLGVVENANVEVKPLTIIVGKNGSGKTHFLQSLYSFYRIMKNSRNIKYTQNSQLDFSNISINIYRNYEGTIVEKNTRYNDFKKKLKAGENSFSLKYNLIKEFKSSFQDESANELKHLLTNDMGILSNIFDIDRYRNNLDTEDGFDEIHQEEEIKKKAEIIKGFSEDISTTFGMNVDKLISENTRIDFISDFNTNHYHFEKEVGEFKNESHYNFKILNVEFLTTYINNIPFVEEITLVIKEIEENEKKKISLDKYQGLRKKIEAIKEKIKNFEIKSEFDISSQADLILIQISTILDLLKTYGFERSNVHYLASSRAGVLLSHRSLASSLLKLSKYVGRERDTFPTLPGAHIDFLIDFIELGSYEQRPTENIGDENAKFYENLDQIVSFIEEEIIMGKFIVSETTSYPEIRFLQNEEEYQLHTVASMLTELSPLYLLLKLFPLSKGDTILFEEPEAHLHPEIISKVARLIARMVNIGINVMITTHNDFILNQLQNLIRLNSIDLKSENLKYNDIDTINSEKVSLTLFELNDNNKAISKSIEIDDQGFLDFPFQKAIDSLYENTIRIDDLVQESKKGE